MKHPRSHNPLRSPERRAPGSSNRRYTGANRRAATGPASLDPASLDPASLDPASLDPASSYSASLDPEPGAGFLAQATDTQKPPKPPSPLNPAGNLTGRSTGPKHRQEKAQTADTDPPIGTGFPPLTLWGTVGNIYQAFLIHLPRILRLAILPFIVSTLAYVSGDLYLGATHVNNNSFWGIAVVVQCVEVFLFYLYSISVYRLMLLGNWESLIRFDRHWGKRFVAYGLRSVTVFLPLMIVTTGSYFLIRYLTSSVSPYFVFMVPFFVVGYFWLFLRLSFALPAASVDAPYSIRDSWRATKFISVRVLMIGCLTVGPPLLLFVAGIMTLNSIMPGIEAEIVDGVAYTINPSYWLITPIGIILSYLLASFVVISTAIMFYYRTGWRPGAIRADQA